MITINPRDVEASTTIGTNAERTALAVGVLPVGALWIESDTGQTFWITGDDGMGAVTWVETPESAALAILTDIATP